MADIFPYHSISSALQSSAQLTMMRYTISDRDLGTSMRTHGLLLYLIRNREPGKNFLIQKARDLKKGVKNAFPIKRERIIMGAETESDTSSEDESFAEGKEKEKAPNSQKQKRKHKRKSSSRKLRESSVCGHIPDNSSHTRFYSSYAYSPVIKQKGNLIVPLTELIVPTFYILTATVVFTSAYVNRSWVQTDKRHKAEIQVLKTLVTEMDGKVSAMEVVVDGALVALEMPRKIGFWTGVLVVATAGWFGSV